MEVKADYCKLRVKCGAWMLVKAEALRSQPRLIEDEHLKC